MSDNDPSVSLLGARVTQTVKRTGKKCNVPHNNIARLMYYLSCVGSCMQVEGNFFPPRLRQYDEYYSLSDDEKKAVVACAILFNPVVTEELRHVIVAVDNAGQFSNDFLEFSQTADLRAMNINPQRAVVIQGKHVQVLKIMIYQMSWLKNNLLNPLEAEMWRVRSRPSPPSVSYRASSPLVYSSSYRRSGGERTCASRLMAFFCFLLVAVSCYLLSRACITFANNDANAQVASEQWDHITDDFTAQFENHSLLVAFTAFLLAVCCACCTSWCGCQYFKRRRSDEKEAKSACNWLVVCGAVSTAAYVYVYWNAFANGVTVQEFQDLPFESYLSLGLAGCTVVTFLVALCIRCARCF